MTHVFPLSALSVSSVACVVALGGGGGGGYSPAYVRQPDLRLYVVNTFAVTQQISAVTLFLVVFMHMQDGLISMGMMVSVCYD